MNRPIADLWSTYAERVLPADAGSVQTAESKRAFYAGAHGLFEQVAHMSDTKTEDQALEFMDSIQADAVRFVEEVEKGKA